MAARKCKNCGAEVTDDLLRGLCPTCVLQQAMAPEADAEPLDEPGGAADTTQSAGPVSEFPGNRIGRYKLLQNLGEGGMGSVWMAEQTEPVRRVVALKIIKPGMDSAEVLARFEAERQALALMDHPNIAKVLDAGTTQPARH